ncbi:MAG: c-type cytochrome [Myxococcota bacterium]
MNATSRCPEHGAAGLRSLLWLLLPGALLACGSEPARVPPPDPEGVLRGELDALRGAALQRAAPGEAEPRARDATGADPSGLLALGDALVVALRGEDAVLLTDGERELARAPAPGAVHALVATAEDGFMAAGDHANVLQGYRLRDGRLEPTSRIVLPGAQGIGALAGGGDVVFAAERHGRAVFRVQLGAVPELRRGEACRQARGLALAGERLVVACGDGGLVALDRATLAPVARAQLPGPLLAVAAWEQEGLRVASSGLGGQGDATRSMLRLHTLEAGGWRLADERESEGAEEARVLRHDGGALQLFGHARGRRQRVAISEDRLVPDAWQPWVPGVRAAVLTPEGALTASALMDALVGEGPGGAPRIALAFAPGEDRFGEVLLTTGMGRPAGVASCGACHLDGFTDFRRHRLEGRAAPVATVPLRGLLEANEGVERLLALAQAHPGAELAPLSDATLRRASAARFVGRWPRALSALALAGRAATPLEAAGRRVFESQCAGCHGRGDAPALDRVAQRGPYGTAWESLEDVLAALRTEPFSHSASDGEPLPPRDREALRAFLQLL